MGIQINGNNDIISALDGSWTAEGASINTSGILTATTFKGNIVGTAATFTGPVTIGGTLTYEDVTNIDSVGIITARDGLKVLGGGANVVGVVTATSFVGGLPITSGADNRVITASSASAIQGEANLTFDGSVFYIGNSTPKLQMNDGNGRIVELIGGSTSTGPEIRTGYAGDLRIGTNSQERIRVAGVTGYVGINTTGANNAPAAPLHIYGNSNTTPIIAFTRSTTHDDWQGGGIGLVDEGGTYKGALTFYTHSSSGTKNDSVTEKIRITSNGYFGVGETPTTKVGVALAAQQADGTDDASDWGAGGIFQLDATGSAANGNEILLLGAHSGGVGHIASGLGFGRENTGNWGTYLSFKTHSTSTSNIDELNEKLRITSGGAVGINTTVPSTSQDLTFDGASNYKAGIFYKQAGVNQYRFMCEGGTGHVYYDTFVDGGDHIFRTNAQATGGSEKVRFTEEGKVGIGIDPTAKLHVNGVTGTDIITARAADTNGSSVINILAEGTTGISRINFSDTAGADAWISYYHSDRAFAFATAGTGNERIRIDSNGMFHISDRNSGNAGEHVFQAGAFGIRMQDTGGYNRWNIERNYGGWQSTPLVHLSAQGRVGINEASPDSQLHITGGSNENVSLKLEPGGTAGNYSEIVLGRTSSAPAAQTTPVVKGGIPVSGVPGIMFGSENTNLPAIGFQTPNSSNGHIVFSPKGSERLRITADGTLLVNTSSTNNVTSRGLKIQTAAVNGIAWALNLRNPDVTAAGNAAVGIQFNMDRSPSGGIEFQAGSIVCRKNQNWTTTPTTIESDMVFGVQKDETLVNRFIIYADGMTETNGVHEFNAAFMLSNNTAYNWDINVESEGSRGNSFYVVAGYNHFHTTVYGAHLVGFYCARQTSITRNANIADVSHSNAGQWSVSKPNNGTLRVTKSAGSYGGTGYGFIRVTFQQL